MSSSTSTLDGQTILIVGGTSGIGFGVALASLDAGAETVIVASSAPEKVERAVERLKAQSSQKGGIVKGVVIDANDLVGVEKVVKELGTINHLVWTSGEVGFTGSLNIKEADIVKLSEYKVLQIRFWAAIQAIKSATFAPGGSVILTSGSAYKKPFPGLGIASGLAAAVSAVTKGLALDLAPSIRVNCVAPGLIDTELFDKMPPQVKDVLFERGINSTVLKKAGKPADIAEAYLFLMKCSFITGQVLEVDGGVSLV